ncbi:MAG: hypothetical protein ABI572_04825 [Actinomycetota bacterium]
MKDGTKKRRLVAAGAIALAFGLVSACSSDSSSSTTTPAATTPAATTSSASGSSTVAITLQEFAVSAAPATAPAGSVTFDVTNNGPKDTHEFVVFKTDLGPTELPVDDKGAVVEDGAGVEHIDEIEDITVGSTKTLTLDLAAGNYVLICNIYEKSDQTAHYSEGMRIGFTVE